MGLVDIYVETVRKQLPRPQRDDIAAELRDTLQSQIEALEAESGRPATDDEISAMLKRYGAPEVVASRYGAHSHLIGPDVYPQYRATVRIVGWILAGILSIALVATATLADNPAPAMWRILWTGAFVVLAHFTALTLIFARVDRLKRGAEPGWDPHDLVATPPPRTSIPRSEAIAGLLLTTLWLLWWMDVVPVTLWLLRSRLPIEPAAIWNQLTPLIVTLMLVNIGVSAVALIRRRWLHVYDAVCLLLDIGIGVVIYLALRAPALIVVTDPGSPAGRLASVVQTALTVGLVIWLLIAIGSVVATLRRWVVAGRQRGSIQNWAW